MLNFIYFFNKETGSFFLNLIFKFYLNKSIIYDFLLIKKVTTSS